MADQRPRRATTAQRDPARTRQALLDAALSEFSEKGLAGARVADIAARAGVNKQLISYHFDGKAGLYRALVERWLAHEQEFADPALPLGDLVARYVHDTLRDREMARLFLRECLEDAAPPGGDANGAGTEEPEEVADLRRRQRDGELHPDVDPAFLMLVLQSAASAGVAFPADARRFTGLEPDSAEFADRYGEQLKRIVALLAPRDDG